MNNNKPLASQVLIILDGWGHSEQHEGNAIMQARTPVWDRWMETRPHTLISGSGVHVGLPGDQMGNSEVGHLNLGAGRIVSQDVTRINHDIEQGKFNSKNAFNTAIRRARMDGGHIHVMGLLSDGGVHSHHRQIHALLRALSEQGAEQVWLHAFLDGRDTPPKSAVGFIRETEQLFQKTGCGRFATVVGRYFAMDRDKRWERTEHAYRAIVEAQAAQHATTALQALQQAYDQDLTDEFVPATVLGDYKGIQAEDQVILMNFRADRIRELTEAFYDPAFSGFERQRVLDASAITTLTEYADSYPVNVAYSPDRLDHTFGQHVSDLGLTQLRIAETEKYAHVTFFFNGGREKPFPGEERCLIPSPKVATYDLQPEMNAGQLTDKLVEAILGGQYDVIICNYANADMVGHSGKLVEAIAAIESIDGCLERVEQALQEAGAEALVTADHGNAEQMLNKQTGQPHTAHTSNPVPIVYLGRQAKVVKDDGSLVDVTPTLLSLMGLPRSALMTGKPLFEVLD